MPAKVKAKAKSNAPNTMPPLEVLAWSDDPEQFIQPCVDCGLFRLLLRLLLRSGP